MVSEVKIGLLQFMLLSICRQVRRLDFVTLACRQRRLKGTSSLNSYQHVFYTSLIPCQLYTFYPIFDALWPILWLFAVKLTKPKSKSDLEIVNITKTIFTITWTRTLQAGGSTSLVKLWSTVKFWNPENDPFISHQNRPAKEKSLK